MRLSLKSQLSIAVVFLLLIPVASAHGANSFSFIMRNGSLQPESAEIVQNDTLIFYNVVEYERSLELDKDEDGVMDYQCTASGFAQHNYQPPTVKDCPICVQHGNSDKLTSCDSMSFT